MTRIEPSDSLAPPVDAADPPAEPTADPTAASRWRRPWVLVALVTAAIGLPLLVAVAALRRETWYPVLDLAMTELRVRDVGTGHTPLIGLPGRIGEYPNQGSHPGPLSFYLLAPTYRLLGSTSWALEVGTVVIHLAAIATALWIGHRRGGWRGVAFVAALLAVVVRGYGQVVLTQPWNPYLPLVPWIVVLLATWSVLCGDHWMLVPLVVAGTFCAQTHVPYLLLCVVLAGLAIAVVAVRTWRDRTGTTGATGTTDDAARRGRLAGLGALVVTAGVGVVLWLPPLIDQLTNDPGNLRRLLDHFGSPPEAALGIVDGGRLALRHLDVWAGLGGQLAGTGRFVSAASAGRGAVTLVVWAAAAIVAWRAGPRAERPAAPALRALHVVVAVALAAGWFSMARIFGRPWFYLTLWAWGVTALAVGAAVWTAVDRWSARSVATGSSSERSDATVSSSARRLELAERLRDGLAIAAAAVAALATVATAIAFADAHHPEERLSDAVGTLAGPTYDAVVAGTGAAAGPDGHYLVRWSDAADIGSPGFGLLDELERRGLDVAADDYFHVPVTDHRVRPRAGNDAQIHLATGGYIARWRAVPGAVPVARFDPRSDAQRAEYREVRARLLDRLTSEGLDELAAGIDTNLFGTALDPRLSAADQDDLTILLDLGQAMAVFIAPAPADGDAAAP